MAATAFWFGKFFCNVMGGETAGESSFVDYLSDTMKYLLFTSSYVPNQNTDEFLSTPRANEVSGPGYTANGVTLTTKTLSYATKVTTLDADDVSWTVATFTTRIGVICCYTNSVAVSDATRPLLLWQDFGADQSPSGGTLTLTMNASGIATITVA